MKLIVGLGNPGRGIRIDAAQPGFHSGGHAGRAQRNSHNAPRSEIVPRARRNRGPGSGHREAADDDESERRCCARHASALRVHAGHLILLSDEAALPQGMIRINERGSAAGHNGSNSIVQAAGMEFIRVRMGVKPEHPISDLADYVLCPMNREHREIAQQMAADAAEAVEIILGEGASQSHGEIQSPRRTGTRRRKPSADADIDA